eukprot:jgi/Chrpa1/2751/Chrysochromulina_OHIO_Genome00008613-RA
MQARCDATCRRSSCGVSAASFPAATSFTAASSSSCEETSRSIWRWRAQSCRRVPSASALAASAMRCHSTCALASFSSAIVSAASRAACPASARIRLRSYESRSPAASHSAATWLAALASPAAPLAPRSTSSSVGEQELLLHHEPLSSRELALERRDARAHRVALGLRVLGLFPPSHRIALEALARRGMQSRVIEGHQRSLRHAHLMRDAIKGTLRSSEVITGRQRSSAHRLARAPDEERNQGHSEVIRGHQRTASRASPSRASAAASAVSSAATLITLASRPRSSRAASAWAAARSRRIASSSRGRNQRSSRVIRGHQRSSEVIRGHPRSSEVIRGHPRSSEVIKFELEGRPRASLFASVAISFCAAAIGVGGALDTALDGAPALDTALMDGSASCGRALCRAPCCGAPGSMDAGASVVSAAAAAAAAAAVLGDDGRDDGREGAAASTATSSSSALRALGGELAHDAALGGDARDGAQPELLAFVVGVVSLHLCLERCPLRLENLFLALGTALGPFTAVLSASSSASAVEARDSAATARASASTATAFASASAADADWSAVLSASTSAAAAAGGRSLNDEKSIRAPCAWLSHDGVSGGAGLWAMAGLWALLGLWAMAGLWAMVGLWALLGLWALVGLWAMLRLERVELSAHLSAGVALGARQPRARFLGSDFFVREPELGFERVDARLPLLLVLRRRRGGLLLLLLLLLLLSREAGLITFTPMPFSPMVAGVAGGAPSAGESKAISGESEESKAISGGAGESNAISVSPPPDQAPAPAGMGESGGAAVDVAAAAAAAASATRSRSSSAAFSADMALNLTTVEDALVLGAQQVFDLVVIVEDLPDGCARVLDQMASALDALRQPGCLQCGHLGDLRSILTQALGLLDRVLAQTLGILGS